MSSLGRNIKDAVRKIAFRTSVDQLRRRGVKQVNVVGLDRIAALIEEAVHRSLRHRMMGVDRDAIAGATKQEFLRLLRTNEDLQRSHDEAIEARHRADQELDEMRRELAQQEQALREKLQDAKVASRAEYVAQDQAIAERVDAVFAELNNRIRGDGDEGPDLDALRERMYEVVTEVVGDERQSALQAREAARDREVDLLERRIVKLTSALSDTENKLQRAASAGPVEAGISSIYRDVQGLAGDDDQFEKKSALMTDIFKANLALQRGS